jgi:hypothetical protein
MPHLRPSRRATLHALAASLALAGATACHDRDEHGVWRSEGYGYVLDNRGHAPVYYELGRATCLPKPDLYEPYGLGRTQLSDHGRRMTVWFPLDAGPVTFRRLDDLPAACRDGGTPKAGDPGYTDDPVFTLTALCDAFREHHAFLSQRNPRFLEECDQAIAALAAEPTAERLTALSRSLIESLGDGHVTLYAGDEEYGSEPPSQLELTLRAEFEAQDEYPDFGKYLAAQATRFHEIVTGYVGGELSTAADGAVSWGRLGDRAGYLAIENMMDPQQPDTEQGQVGTFGAAVDAALAELRDLPALVIDLRLNSGGHDVVGLAVAGRLTATPYTAFRISARQPDGFGRPVAVQVKPAGAGAPYRGKVIVLTSELSASATEVFLLALMGRQDVIRVGGTTAGVYSDIFPRALPNGWVVTVSNERYEAIDGVCYEGVGLSPDVPVEFFARADREAGRDAALEAALELL